MSTTEKYALLSLFNKEGSEGIARRLIELGYMILSSGGTAKHLREHGIEVTDMEEFTGQKPILRHRVVTLHPKLHAGLLADPVIDADEMAELGFPFIDVVWVDLYSIDRAIATPGATIESVREKTDIGGPTMLRSAAKGLRYVAANLRHMEKVLDWLEGDKDLRRKTTEANFRLTLAGFAESAALAHVGTSAVYLTEAAVPF